MRSTSGRIAVSMAAVLIPLGCSASEPSTPVTHDESVLESSLISGTLAGTAECLWLEIGQDHRALVLPPGSKTRRDDGKVVLLGSEGNEVARLGDEVAVTGGFRPDAESCIDGQEKGAIVVGSIRRGDG